MAQALELIPELGHVPAGVLHEPHAARATSVARWSRSRSTDGSLRSHGQARNDFDGVPVKRCDALLNTEALVS
jgi:hypothetical protein